MSSLQARVRRPLGSGTRVAIELAARRRFAELFVVVVELPFEPEPTFEALLAEFVLGMLDREETDLRHERAF
jgi:hypothetical protein